MINILSLWSEKIVIAIFITSIVEMILPENNNKKYIKMIMGIYILFTIISPLFKEKLDINVSNIESYVSDFTKSKNEITEVNQTSMDERLQELYIKELENNIREKIEEEGYDVSSCKVDAKLLGNEKNRGINKVILVVIKKNSNKSNINNIDDIEINIGANKYFNTKIEDTEADNLKTILSTYYEIEKEKIQISIK